MSSRLGKPYDYAIDFIETTGPASYTTGGFDIVVSRLRRVLFAIVVIEPPDTDNLVYKAEIASISGNVIRVVVKTIDVTAAAPASWTEVAAGTDLSAMKIRVIAIGV